MEQELQTNDNAILDLNMRIRILEEKQNLIRERILVINQNMVEEYKNLVMEIKTINSDIIELKEEISNMNDMTRHIIKDMEKFARIDSVKVLEKYIKIWDPMKFTTEEDVISIIKSYLSNQKEVELNGKKTK